MHTVSLVYNDHPWDPKLVVVVFKWSLFRVINVIEVQYGTPYGGRYGQVVAIRRYLLAQV